MSSSSSFQTEAEYVPIWNQNLQSGVAYYLVSPGGQPLPTFPQVLTLGSFLSVSISWSLFSGTLTLQDVDPQTQLPVGSAVTFSLSGSGTRGQAFQSVTGSVSVSVSPATGFPSSSSALTMIAFAQTVGASSAGYTLDSTTPLAANASFTGQAVDVSSMDNSYIDTEANSDQTGNLYVDFSEDNFQTVAFSASVAMTSQSTPSASNPFVSGTYAYNAQAHVALLSRYVRVRYVNGSTAQTHFQLSHRFTLA